MAGVALRALDWLWWCAWTGLVAGDAAALCVAGVALGDIRLRYTPSFTHNISHALFHTTFRHTIFHTQLCHTHHLSLSHNIFHIRLCHIPFFSLSILHHILCLFFIPRPPPTFVDHYWKKLTCGAIRSFNFLLNMRLLDFIGDFTAGHV